MITFLAYHGDPERRQRTIHRIVDLIKSGRLASDGDGERMRLTAAFGEGRHDLSCAHYHSGFPSPLLMICDAIHEGLPVEDAPAFVLSLARAARLDADLADVARRFMDWMLADAVAMEASQCFSKRAGLHALTPTQQRRTKARAVAPDCSGDQAAHAVHWIASIAPSPIDQYRRFGRKVLELVETA